MDNRCENKCENRYSVWNVLDFGARPDGVTDNTKAFQSALDACSEAGGGTVFAPTGKYMIKGSLKVEQKVVLKGAGGMIDGWGEPTVLLAVNKEEPFIRLQDSGSVHYVHITYPEQSTVPPAIEYPYTIAAEGDNCSIIGVSIENPYNAISLDGAGRHLVRDVQGNPLNIGIYVDQCYDVGRIENVHFWPFFGPKQQPRYEEMYKYIMENAVAFLFGRADWEYVFNTFSWGYKVGYKFIETPSGSCNGNFTGIGADATNIAVLVESCQRGNGLLITNGEFVSIMGENPTAFVIKDTNRGYVNITNSSVWGPSHQIANIAGAGKVSFNNCNFINYDKDNKLVPVIDVRGGDLIVSGNRFGGSCHSDPEPPQVAIRQGTDTAVIFGNSSKNGWEVINESDAAVEVMCNAAKRKTQ